MSDNLTTLLTRVQKQLIDDGTRFNTDTCTAAIREALKEINTTAPQHKQASITPVSNTLIYSITAADPRAFEVLSTFIEGAYDQHTELKYDGYFLNETLFIRTREYINTAETILVNYAAFHTINGLDAESTSTLSSFADQVLVDGACFHAIMFRAASRIETINLQQQVSDNYREIASHFRAAFESGLSLLARRRAPVGTPNKSAWNDELQNI